MKMKLLAMTILVIATIWSAEKHIKAESLKSLNFEAQGGILASESSQASAYGVRLGATRGFWDFSAGYWGVSGGKYGLKSGDLDLHTINLEIARIWPIAGGLKANLSGSIGYTIPNLGSGASETADNGHSWLVGAGIEKVLTPGLSLGASVKGFFFRTDTHLTTYGSHVETLSNGQDVEVVDVSPQDNSVNFENLLVMISLKWR